MIPRLPRSASVRRARRGAEAGATFAEVMLASMVLGAAVVASTASMRGSTEVYHYFADGPHEALMLAQEIHEAAVLLPWEADPGDDPLFGDDVYELDDLDGMAYEPPRSAEYELVISHPQWRQEVAVKRVDLDNPTVEVDPDTFVGEMLTELEVTVFNGDVEVGVFSWWMSEPASSDE